MSAEWHGSTWESPTAGPRRAIWAHSGKGHLLGIAYEQDGYWRAHRAGAEDTYPAWDASRLPGEFAEWLDAFMAPAVTLLAQWGES